MRLALIIFTFLIAYDHTDSSSIERQSDRPTDEWGHELGPDIGYKSIVAIYEDSDSSHRGDSIPASCAGVILNKRHILTAATCVAGKSVKKIKLFSSSVHLKRERGVVFGIRKVISKEPCGSQDVEDNVAILVTDRNMYVNDDRQWASITDDFVDQNGINVTICGWAEIDTGSINSLMKCKSYFTVTVDECKRHNNDVSSSNICVRPSGTDNEHWRSCQFGEGGPIFDENGRVLGIATPDLTCQDDATSVFTRVSAHYDWNGVSTMKINIAIIVAILLMLNVLSI